MIDPVSTRTAGKSVCHVCGRSFPAPRLRPWISVRPGVSELIAATAPGWGEGKQICQPDLARFRRDYVERLLADERGELA
ncbi:MAG TPA: hypothetical protein EYO87_08700, partial [Paracoccus sp.]|nr:hypothetical protein [Paracoccus sp. (in: a-proteobacteria)]